jgi:hypothetical protein
MTVRDGMMSRRRYWRTIAPGSANPRRRGRASPTLETQVDRMGVMPAGA